MALVRVRASGRLLLSRERWPRFRPGKRLSTSGWRGAQHGPSYAFDRCFQSDPTARLATVAWRKGNKLGWGRFGVVYDAVRDDDPLGAEALHAIKFLQRDLMVSLEIVQRFQREIQISKHLNHENLMPIVASGETTKGVPYFVMPKAQDGSLKDAIERGDSRDRDWTVRIFRGILAGVAHAHETSVLHRDIKPSNVLLYGLVPKVSDFGIAKQLDLDGTTLTQSAQELGTLRYMAPEQLADSKRAGKAADVYSLGKVLAHMLTGKPPEPFKVDISALPDEFQFFVNKCCRSEPSERYSDAGVALEAFERCMAEERTISPPPDRLAELAEVVATARAEDDKLYALEELDLHIRAHPDDREMFRDIWIRLPKETMWTLAARVPDGFREQLRMFDDLVCESGGMNFGFTDVVADRYRYIFSASNDLDVRRIVLRRLVDLGYSHNRFHVRDVLVELLASLENRTDVAIAEEALLDNARAAEWISEEALRRPLREPIAAVLRRVGREAQASGF